MQGEIFQQKRDNSRDIYYIWTLHPPKDVSLGNYAYATSKGRRDNSRDIYYIWTLHPPKDVSLGNYAYATSKGRRNIQNEHPLLLFVPVLFFIQPLVT